MPLPTHVIGGYLGAGKTTLVNQLLRQARGERIAVLVNDFGDTSIDADLIVGQDGDVLALAGGCVCCSFGSDLVGTLATLQRRPQPPQRVLIETSGVGLPAAVARSARLAPGIAIEGIVVVADAPSVRAQAHDRYMGDTVRQQLADADLLLLNKADAVDAATLEPLRAWLQGMAPVAACVSSVRSQVPSALVYGASTQADSTQGDDEGGWHFGPIAAAQTTTAADVFVSHRLALAPVVDVPALAACLSAPESGILRAKGWVRDGAGARWLIQVVGRRAEVSPAPALSPQAGDGAHSDALVLIGLRGVFDPQAW